MNRIIFGLSILLSAFLSISVYYFLFTTRTTSDYVSKSTPTSTDKRDLIIDSVSDLPKIGSLNLVLTARVIDNQENLLEITVRIINEDSQSAYEDVRGEIQLPAGLTLKQGGLHWQGDIQGEEIKQFQAIVQATQELKGEVEATARAYLSPGTVHGDIELFYVRVEKGTMRVSVDPYLIWGDPSTPGIHRLQE